MTPISFIVTTRRFPEFAPCNDYVTTFHFHRIPATDEIKLRMQLHTHVYPLRVSIVQYGAFREKDKNLLRIRTWRTEDLATIGTGQCLLIIYCWSSTYRCSAAPHLSRENIGGGDEVGGSPDVPPKDGETHADEERKDEAGEAGRNTHGKC